MHMVLLSMAKDAILLCSVCDACAQYTVDLPFPISYLVSKYSSYCKYYYVPEMSVHWIACTHTVHAGELACNTEC